MSGHSWFLIEWGIRLVMGVVVITRRRAMPAVLAWLVVVALVPIAGAVAYLLVGANRLGSRRSRAYRATIAQWRGRADGARRAPDAAFVAAVPEPHRALARLATALGAGSATTDAPPRLLTEVDVFTDALVADLDAARQHCHLLYFIFQPDDVGAAIAGALGRAAQRGVSCRLLVDAVGSHAFLTSALVGELRRQGVAVVAALPVGLLRAAVARLDLRNHRKLAIVDGRIAHVGSHNVADPIYPHKARFGAWVDATVRISGPVVRELAEIFAQDWVFNGGSLAGFVDGAADDGAGAAPVGVPVQVLPTGPANEGAPLVDVLAQAIAMAQRRVVLTTPYFVPNDALLASLRSAALRGIEVLLIVPRRSDHAIAQAAGRSHYGWLLDLGVAVHEYAGGLLHAKTLVVDDDLTVVGSANLDVRSFLLNFELAVLVYDRRFAAQMQTLHASYLARSRAVDPAAWHRRGRLREIRDDVARLLSPLL